MLLVDDQSLSTPETIVGCPCCVSRPMSARICVRRGARACTGVAAARQRLQQVTRRSNNERQRHPCASAAKVDDDDEFGPRASHRAKSAESGLRPCCCIRGLGWRRHVPANAARIRLLGGHHRHILSIRRRLVRQRHERPAPGTRRSPHGSWSTFSRSRTLHHSDRGSPYAREDDQAVLNISGFVCSMSRRGNCCDNAVVESFFKSLKREFGDDVSSAADAWRKLFEHLEIWFHRNALHSSPGLLEPGRA